MPVLTRFRFPKTYQVRNIPKSVRESDPERSEPLIRAAFGSPPDVKGIFVRHVEMHGIVILAYFDSRVARTAAEAISNKFLYELCPEIDYRRDGEQERRLEAVCVDISALDRVSAFPLSSHLHTAQFPLY